MADKKVTANRPGKGRTLTLPREVKIRNTIYRSRQSTTGRPDAVGV
ncbi:hypothetical protein [Streptomyces brasiliensis]|nr:hypothetical protein [Streptomyces brasiliensis]